MTILDKAKEAASLAEQLEDTDLQQLILELRGESLELLEELHTLRERVGELEAAAQSASELEFKDNAYWRGADGPFCSQCRDSGGALIRLHMMGSGSQRCPTCKIYAKPLNLSFRVSRE